MWKGLKIHTHLAVYKKDGKEYPAYCMNRELPGVEIGRSQTVDVKQLVNNVMVWRTIINGYPYKSISELGCNTEEEAYLATKQAVYCMLTNRDVNEYSAIGEAGERTLNALKTIVNNARNSNQTKVSSELTVNEQEKLWKIDNLDSSYISKTFLVTANTSMSKYTVNVKNLNIEGYKLVDQNNKYYLAPNVARIRINNSKVLPKFVMYFLQTPEFKVNQLDKLTGASSMKNITMTNIRKFKIPLPSIEEQERIVNILDKFDKYCNNISEGLPAEIEARQRQYEYYRDKLLTFKELKVNE